MATRNLLTAAALAAALGTAGVAHAEGQATFYNRTDLGGTNLTIANPVEELEIEGARAHSALIRSGRWEVCTRTGYRGRCTVLEPGEYRKLHEEFGFVASAREVSSIAEDERGRYWSPRERGYRR